MKWGEVFCLFIFFLYNYCLTVLTNKNVLWLALVWFSLSEHCWKGHFSLFLLFCHQHCPNTYQSSQDNELGTNSNIISFPVGCVHDTYLLVRDKAIWFTGQDICISFMSPLSTELGIELSKFIARNTKIEI